MFWDAVRELELRNGVNHVNWRYEGRPETKVLKIAGTLRNASSTNPRTWRTLRECIEAMKRHPYRYAGMGRVIAREDPYVGAVLDDVRDPERGKLSSTAAEITGQLDSYAEVSPSAAGVKLWVRAELGRAYKKRGLEVYSHGRYFTLTGWMLPHSLATVALRGDAAHWLSDPEYAALRHRLEAAHVGTEAVASAWHSRALVCAEVCRIGGEDGVRTD